MAMAVADFKRADQIDKAKSPIPRTYLSSLIDKEVIILFKDGTSCYATLRGFDNFFNLTLESPKFIGRALPTQMRGKRVVIRGDAVLLIAPREGS